MAVIATWNGMKWESRSGRLFTISGFSTGRKAKTETDNDNKGSSAQKIVGEELEQISFSTTSGFMVGVDMRAEYMKFRKLVNKSAPFILRGERLGAAKYRLDDVQLSEPLFDGKGRIVSATLSFTFIEFADEAAKDKESSGSASTAPGIKSQSETNALYVGPTADDKIAMKGSG